MTYDLIIKAMCRMARIMPQTFESDVDSMIHESDGLLNREAAAYLVMNEMGYRLDTHVMGSKESTVFTYLFSKKAINNKEVR